MNASTPPTGNWPGQLPLPGSWPGQVPLPYPDGVNDDEGLGEADPWSDDYEPSLGALTGVEPALAASRPDDDLVARCLDDLLDDWMRKGGKLSYDDITRMTTKRGLDGLQLASLLSALDQAGVTVAGLQPARDGANPEIVDGPTGENVVIADRDLLGTYLKEIGKYRLLWAEDEVRLGRQIRAGQEADAALSDGAGRIPPDLRARLRDASLAGRRAHADLVSSNLRLVVSTARRVSRLDLDLLDVIQDGNLGLMRAADKFDYTLGYKFSTYATWWITQAITRGIADKGRLIRLPVHFHDKLMKILRMQRELNRRHGREPELAELAVALDMDPGEVQGALDWSQPVVSLDRPVGEGDVTLGDLLADDADIDGRTDPADMVVDSARQRDIDLVLDEILDERSAEIIRRRFGLSGRPEETLDTIGQLFGVTRERIRQLEDKAMKALRESTAARNLYEYLISQTSYARACPHGGWPPPEQKRRRSRLQGQVLTQIGGDHRPSVQRRSA
jgi:RNA polymerase sigma factor (sigma-70 family)